jgi:hypothetical protein
MTVEIFISGMKNGLLQTGLHLTETGVKEIQKR